MYIYQSSVHSLMDTYFHLAIINNSVEIIEGNHLPYNGTFEIMGIERLWWPKIKALI